MLDGATLSCAGSPVLLRSWGLSPAPHQALPGKTQGRMLFICGSVCPSAGPDTTSCVHALTIPVSRDPPTVVSGCL